jgi:hypothetical protein
MQWRITMSVRISRENTAAISALTLVLASSLFVIGVALGDPATQEIVDTAALRGAATEEKSVAHAGRVVTLPERKTATKDEPPGVVDMSVVYPHEGKNPTDEPLALFNTPIH